MATTSTDALPPYIFLWEFCVFRSPICDPFDVVFVSGVIEGPGFIVRQCCDIVALRDCPFLFFAPVLVEYQLTVETD